MVTRNFALSLLIVASIPAATAFAQWDAIQGQILFSSDRDGDEEIFKAKVTANADVVEETQLTFNKDQDNGARFSPDGSKIAFVRNGKEIWLMDSQGGNPQFIHNGTGVDFSPDGTKLALSDTSVYTYDLATHELVNIWHASIYVGSSDAPRWSPDGTKVIFKNTFVYMFPHFTNVMQVDADGSNGVKLTGYDEYNDIRVNNPQWSPDGSKIAYQCDSRICVMNADGSNQVYPFSLTVGGTSSSPVWSPDGAWLLFNLADSSRQAFNGKLFLLKLDLTKASSFTDSGGKNYPSDWRKTGGSATIQPSECLFNWAEQNYPGLFSPAGAATASLPPYAYRYYSATHAYLGVSAADNHVYYLGGDGQLLDAGPTAYWYGLAGCR